MYSRANYEAINKEIKTIDWTKEYNNKSMTEMWEHFKQCYTQLVEKHVPVKQIKQGSRLKPPWVRYKSVQKAKKVNILNK